MMSRRVRTCARVCYVGGAACCGHGHGVGRGRARAHVSCDVSVSIELGPSRSSEEGRRGARVPVPRPARVRGAVTRFLVSFHHTSKASFTIAHDNRIRINALPRVRCVAHARHSRSHSRPAPCPECESATSSSDLLARIEAWSLSCRSVPRCTSRPLPHASPHAVHCMFTRTSARNKSTLAHIVAASRRLCSHLQDPTPHACEHMENVVQRRPRSRLHPKLLVGAGRTRRFGGGWRRLSRFSEGCGKPCSRR